MRSNTVLALVLAAAATGCGPAASGGGAGGGTTSSRAAASVVPSAIVCGDGECGWVLQPGACQLVAEHLELDGTFLELTAHELSGGESSATAGRVSFVVKPSLDGTRVDWSGSTGADLVIVPGPQGANVYRYDPEATSDAGLQSVNGLPIASVTICYDLEDAGAGCTLTQGYWKNHGVHGPGAFDEAWLHVGQAADDELFAISGLTWHEVLESPPKRNAWYALAHQYIAARLNVLAGADGAAVAAELAWADRFFAAHGPDYVFRPSMSPVLGRTAAAFDAFNNGATGPGHCGE